MHNLTTDIGLLMDELDAIQLPGSLMESFDAYREDSYRSASAKFTPSALEWYLDLLNRFRGPDNRRYSLVGVFDPVMCKADHPAWNAPPGTRIEMPALTSDVASLANRDSAFAAIAREEIREFRDLADSFADEELLGLASIGRAALVDRTTAFRGREDAIRYLALNASTALESLWRADDDAVWPKAPARQIEFEDMLAKKQVELRRGEAGWPPFEEKEFACFTEDEIRDCTFDIRKLLLTGRGRHLAICSRCLLRLKYWSAMFDRLERATPLRDGRPDA